jgi:hypothetical protein
MRHLSTSVRQTLNQPRLTPLMPASAVREWVKEFALRSDSKPPFAAESALSIQFISTVAKGCDVSDLAARIRLLKLGLLSEP